MHEPEDDRWLGYCLLMLQRPLEAREALMRARARGCTAADIELSTLHRHLGELELAKSIMLEFDESNADSLDRALAAREWGMLYFTLGDLGAAANAFETALRHASKTLHGQSLEPAINFMLGRTLADKGHSHRAIHHLDSALASSHGDKRILKLGVRAECLIHMGRLEEARHDLQEAETLLPLQPLSVPVMRYMNGILARAEGRFDEAIGTLTDAVKRACDTDGIETELYARLELCAILTHLEAFAEARSHLARARAISNCAKTDALVDWRAGALQARLEDREALAALERSLRVFEGLKLERECGWVRLHLAEAHARAGQTLEVERWLNAATDTRHALTEGSALYIELRTLPNTLAALQALPEDAYAHVLLEDLRGARGSVPVTVAMRSMGGAGLLADRQKVKLNAGLPVTVEVIAYLLLHPGRTLEQILGDVAFPDPAPERAKSYFHLVRNEIKNALPGVSVPYHGATRTYSVDFGGVSASVDFLELERLLQAGDEPGLRRALELYRGPFLPYSESDWAGVQRERLEFALVNAALRVIESHYVAGRFEQSARIAERVLEIVPTDIALNLCLVRAMQAKNGALAGRQALERVQHRFLNELGEVPPAFLDEAALSLTLA